MPKGLISKPAPCIVVAAWLICGGTQAQSHTINLASADQATIASALSQIPNLQASLPKGEAIEILLPAGEWRLNQPIVIDKAHGGTPDHPLILSGSESGQTRLLGSVHLSSRPANAGDGAPPKAQVVDLRPLGAAPVMRLYGTYTPKTPADFMLFQGGSRLMPSRWPVSGWLSPISRTANGTSDAVLIIDKAQARAFEQEKDLAVIGYWNVAWDFQSTPVSGIDSATGEVKSATRHSGVHVGPWSKLAITNSLSALSQPGTFHLDSQRQQAIVLPTADQSDYEAATIPSFLQISDAGNITLRNIIFDRALGDGIVIKNGQDIAIDTCAVRQTGGNGITITGGHHVTVTHSLISETGRGGVYALGGDRARLIAGEHAVVNSVINQFGVDLRTYSPGIRLEGDGNIAQGNFISRGDHVGLMFSGNDQRIVGNEISHVLLDAEDMGAIYSGADWVARGNVIVGNYIHDLGGRNGTGFLSGIYLDDQFSSARVEQNVITGGVYSVVIGGGRDNILQQNLLINPVKAALHFDARGLGNQAGRTPSFIAEAAKLPWSSEVWRARYPELNNFSQQEFGHPAGNAFVGNDVFASALLATDPIKLNYGPMLKVEANAQNAKWSGDVTEIAREARRFGLTMKMALRQAALSDLANWFAIKAPEKSP